MNKKLAEEKVAMPGSAQLSMGSDDHLPVSPTPTMSSTGSRDSISVSTREYKGSKAFRESREYIDIRKPTAYDVRSESGESMEEKSTSGSSHKHDLSSEFIPTRTKKVATSRPAYNPLQFIRTGPAPLFQTAQQQLKQAEELKKIRTVVKEEPEEWQANLEGWKMNRRKRQEDVIERVTEVKKFEKDEAWQKCDEAAKKSAKFNQMMEKRPSRARLMDLNVYTEDDNDLGELLSPLSPSEPEIPLTPATTSFREDTTPLQITEHVQESQEITTQEEYTYDKAIESYRKVTSALTKTETLPSASMSFQTSTTTITTSVVETSKDLPKVQENASPKEKEVVLRRSKKVEETVSQLTSKESHNEPAARNKSVDSKNENLVKRRSFFEKSSSEEKDAVRLNRRSMDLSDTLRGKIASLESNADQNAKPRVTPDRDPSFRQKLASFKSTEIDSVSTLLPISQRRNSYTKAITPTFHTSQEDLQQKDQYCPKTLAPEEQKKHLIINEAVEETSIDFRSRLELFRNAEQNPVVRESVNYTERSLRSKPAKIELLHVPIPQEESDCTEDEGIRSLSPRSSDSAHSPTEPVSAGMQNNRHHNNKVVPSFEDMCVREFSSVPSKRDGPEYLKHDQQPKVEGSVPVAVQQTVEDIVEQTEVVQVQFEQSPPKDSLVAVLKEEQTIVKEEQWTEEKDVTDFVQKSEPLQEWFKEPVPVTPEATKEQTIVEDVQKTYSSTTATDYSQLVWEALPSLSLGSFAPTSLAPPIEKPPPPPTEKLPPPPTNNSATEETQEEKFRRIGSTKRIRKEISRRRSDFLGIETDSYYVDPDALVPPPPSIEKILAETEVRSHVLLYQDLNEAPPLLPPAIKPPPVPTWPAEKTQSQVSDEPASNMNDSYDASSQDLQEYVHEAFQQVDEDLNLNAEDLERKEREIIEILEREESLGQEPEALPPTSEQLRTETVSLQEQVQYEPTHFRKQVEMVETIRLQEQLPLKASKHAQFAEQELDEERVWAQQEALIRQRLEHDEWEKQLLEQETEKNYRELQDLEIRQVKQLAKLPQAAFTDVPQPRPRKLLVETPSAPLPSSDATTAKKMPPAVPIKPSRLSLGSAPPVPSVPKSTSYSNLSKLRAVDPDMEPPKRKLLPEKRDVSRHWLIQEAEQRRITELKERNSKRSSEASSGGSISPLLSTRSLSSGSIHTSASPDQSTHSYPVRSVTSGSMDHIQGLGTTNNNAPYYHGRLHSKSVSSLSQPYAEMTNNWFQESNYAPQQQIYANWQQIPAVNQEPPRLPPQPLPPAIIESLTQKAANKSNYPNYGNYMNVSELNYNRYDESGPGPQVPHPPLASSRSAPLLANHVPPNHLPLHQPNQERLLSVSGKKKCSLCGDELGRGAAMIIESLKLFYHMECFCCSVCGVKLGNGTIGTDVRVRNNHLHCHDCYSNDQGLKFSKV